MERPLRAMSYNVRYDTDSDGSNAWKYRRDNVVETVQTYEPDIIGVQEALKHQLTDLETNLPSYTWIGVGRDDGVDGGEFVPIGYRTDHFTELKNGTFWLSKRPDEPGSKNWDAYCPRIVTWILLKSKDNGTQIALFNTHFDHRSALARHRSAELLRSRVQKTAAADVIVVTADLNSPASASPYELLVEPSGRNESPLRDALRASITEYQGPRRTYHEFTGVPFERRDYVFISPSLTALTYEIVDERGCDRYSSDHFPIAVELQHSREI